MSNKEEPEFPATIIARVTYEQKMYMEKNFDTISEGVRSLIDYDMKPEYDIKADIYNV